MLSLLVYVVVICLVVGLAYWILDVIPVPNPLNRIGKILIIVIGCLALIYVLLGVTGTVAPRLP